MLPENRIPAHPGEVLLEEFLVPMGMSQAALARHLGVSPRHISELVQGRRSVSPRMAWLLAQAFGTTPEFWANLQTAHDLAKNRPKRQTQRLQRVR
jgi:antitoxin HigA-1